MYISNNSSTKPASHTVGVIWLICIVIRYLSPWKLLLNQNLLKKKKKSDKWTSCDIYFVLILYSVKQMKSSRTPSSLLFFFFLRVSKLLLSQQTRWTNIFHFVHQLLFSERCPRHKMLQKGRNHISRDVETWINDEMLTVSPSPSDLPGGDFTAQPSLFIHVTSWW